MRGRAEPIDRLAASLARRAAGARRVRGVLVTGGPGSGTSTFLASVARQARGPVWATPGRDARGTAGGLARLLGDLDRLATVADADRRRALERVAWGRRRRGDVALAAEGVCDLARVEGHGAPLVWTIDDAEDLDEPTRTLVSCLVRECPAGPLFVVATSATGDDGWWTARQIRLPPVADDVVRRLIAAGDTLSRRVADELVRVCDGNPAAAAHVGRHLLADHKNGSELLPDPLPMPAALVEHAAGLLGGAGPGERDALLIRAAERRVSRDLETNESCPSWLAEAVLAAADPADLRRAHDRLAATSAEERRAAHRALAADGVDDDRAGPVRRFAVAALAEGDTATALHLHRLAYAVAASAELRASIARGAVTVAVLAGRRGSAARWAARARADGPDDDLTQTAVEGAIRPGPDPEGQRQRLRDALGDAAGSNLADLVPLGALCLRLGVFGAMDGVLEDADRFEALLDQHDAAEDPAAHRVARTALGTARCLATGAPDATGAVAAASENAVARMHEVAARPRVELAAAPTRGALYLGILALADERWRQAGELLSHAAAIEERDGWVGLHADSLGWLAELRWREGRWAEIAGDVRRVLRSPAAAGDYGAMLRAVAVRAGALRQVESTAADQGASLSGGSGVAEAIERHGLGLAALGVGDLRGARAHLQATAAILDGRVDHPGLVTWRVDLAEALAANGEAVEAAAVLDRLDSIVSRNSAELLVVPRLRARAAIRQGRRGVQLLERAADLPCASPFEAARTSLELARRVRIDDVERSRRHAREALVAFEVTGAGGFAHQARQLSGEIIEDPEVAVSVLTSRGREVAAQVAAGMTNADIAAGTGLSEKTVEFHLGKVFRALSLSSRAQLSALLAPQVSSSAASVALGP